MLGLSLAPSTTWATQPAKIGDELWAMVDPAVCTGTCRTVQIPIMIRMTAQVDLASVVGTLRTKAERLPVVVAALKQEAANTQDNGGCSPGLLTYLGQQGSANVSNVVSLWIVNAVAATAVPDVIIALADRADVSEIAYDGNHAGPQVSAGGGGAAAAAAPAAPSPPPNLVAIRAPDVWATGITGACPTGVSGVCAKVGIVSTGVDATHPALAGNLVRRADNSAVWFDALVSTGGCAGGACSACPTADPCDPVGEGTHLAGVAVGTANTIGVAPGASWLACRAEYVAADGRLQADDAALASCLAFMLDPDGNGTSTYAADVIVLPAWKLPGRADRQFVDQLRSLRAAGILPVVAAGHDVFSPLPPDCGVDTNPLDCGLPSTANYPEAVSVGASDNNSPAHLLATTFRGLAAVGALGEPLCGGGVTTGCVAAQPGPRLFGPGINVTSAWPGGGYQVLTYNPEGVAAAHAAGVAALIYGQYAPGAAPPVDYIDRALQVTAAGFVPGAAIPPYAPGQLDAFAAVNFEDAVMVTQQPPGASLQSGTIVPASVSMQNLGVTTWKPASHVLDAVQPIGNDDCAVSQNWGSTRLTMTETAAAPGQVADFPFPVLPGAQAPGARVPLPTGPYLFQWQMHHLSRPVTPETFGANSTATSTTTFGADGISGYVIPTPTAPSPYNTQCTNVGVWFNNTGTATWKPGTYRIKQVAGSSVLAGGYYDLGSNVCSQGWVGIPVTMCIPYAAGTYTWSFQMEKSGTLIGPVVSTSVTVPVIYGATISGYPSYYDFTPGEPGTIYLTVQNTGTVTWPAGCTDYVYDLDAGFWGGSAGCPTTAVPPGGTVQLAPTVTAPNSPGPHTARFQMTGPAGAFGPVWTTSIPIAEVHDVYYEWSSTQGTNGWRYKGWDGTTSWANMTWHTDHWQGPNSNQQIWQDHVQPGTSNGVEIRYTSPFTWNRIRIVLYPEIVSGCGSGAWFKVKMNGASIINFEQFLCVGAGCQGIYDDDTLTINSGDVVEFIINPASGTTEPCSVRLLPSIWRLF